MSQNALGLCNFSFLCLLIVDDDTKMLLLATSTGTQVPRHDLRLKKSFFELVFSKISNSSAVQLDSLKWSTPPQKHGNGSLIHQYQKTTVPLTSLTKHLRKRVDAYGVQSIKYLSENVN